MEQLIMYKCSDGGAEFCLGHKWEKVKKTLHGNVDFMRFNLHDTSPHGIAVKVGQCLEGRACPVGGGHLCLK